MTKILKYFKTVLAIDCTCVWICCLGKRLVNLQCRIICENIVNTGNSECGIESGVYQQIREKTLNSYLMFANDSEKDLITSSYKLVTPSKATKEVKN